MALILYSGIPLFKKLRQQDSTLALWTWTLVGVAIELTLTVVSMLWISGGLAFPFPFPSFAYPPITLTDMRIILGLYLVLPIIYTLPVSLYVFRPKRIVSALNIQLLTIAVFGMILLARMPSSRFLTSDFDYTSFALSFGVIWAGAFLVYGVLGFLQTLFVRWWIGVNPEDLVSKTYSIGFSFHMVSKMLSSKQFLTIRNLEKNVDEHDFLLLRRKTKTPGIVIGLGGDSRGCTLAIFPFEEGLYALAPSEISSSLCTSILNEIKGMLPKGTKLTFVRHPSDIVTSRTHNFAREPTRTKFEITREIWRRMPHYFRYAFVCTILALLLVSVIFSQQSELGVEVPFSIYLELVEILFVALVVELGGPAWQVFSERMRSRPTYIPSS